MEATSSYGRRLKPTSKGRAYNYDKAKPRSQLMEELIDIQPCDSVSQVSRNSRTSRASSRSTHSNISMIRLQEEQRRVELATRAAALDEKRCIEMERQRIENSAFERRQQIDIENQRIEDAALERRQQLKIEQQRLDRETELSRIQIQRMEEDFQLKTEMAISDAKTRVLDRFEYNSVVSNARGSTYTEPPRRLPAVKIDEAPRSDVDMKMRFNDKISGIPEIRPPAPAWHTSTYQSHRLPRQLPNYDDRHGDESTTGLQQTERSQHDPADAINRLADILSNRQDDLPRKEPDVFSGIVYDYPAWICSFETLVERKKSLTSDRLYYLGKYTTGVAKDTIRGLLTLKSDEAYLKAKKLLAERYGDKLTVADAYKKRINDWPPIKYGCGKELQKFSDFLLHCEAAMSTIGYLRSLNDPDEQKKVLRKLPRGTVDRWMRIVDSWLYNPITEYKMMDEDPYNRYPPFSELCKFLAKEARIACSPANFKTDDKKQDPKMERSVKHRGATSFATEADEIRQYTPKFISPASNPAPESKPHCILCKKEHYLETCMDFLKMKLTERRAFVMSKGLCMGCLKWGHLYRGCRNKKVCNTCKRAHPTALHDDSFKPNEMKQPTMDASVKEFKPAERAVSNRVQVSDTDKQTQPDVQACSHSLIVPVMLHHQDSPDHKTLVYALLDPQSDSCFISEATRIKVKANGSQVNLKLKTMLAEKVITSEKINGLVVQDVNGATDIQLPSVYTRDFIPASHSQIPKPDTVKKWPHLRVVADKLYPYQRDVDIGLLIGLNCTHAMKPRDVVPGNDDDPYAVKTALGWGVIGMMHNPASDENSGTYNCRLVRAEENRCHFVFNTQAKEISPVQITAMFEIDFNERKSEEKMSVEDRRFQTKVKDGIHKRDDGHFEIPLPFKQDEVKLPNNRQMAVKRLTRLKNKLMSDARYKADYVAFMNNMIDKGYAERVSTDECTQIDDPKWYIPHHGVYHPKKPGKIRVVFDCSAEFQDESLNRHLLQGPDLTNNLTGVLCRFRKEPVAFTCDIEGMFHQVGVDESHRDYLRFLWWEDGELDQEPSEFRMTVHLFGATSSPGCANSALKATADMYEDVYGKEAAEFVRRDFYVDDGLKSVETPLEALNLIESSNKLCAQGGFRLHKYISNSKDVVNSIPPDERAKGIQNL